MGSIHSLILYVSAQLYPLGMLYDFDSECHTWRGLDDSSLSAD